MDDESKYLELISKDKEYTDTEKRITDIERRFMEIAPTEVIDLYKEIDFLSEQQKNRVLSILKKYL